MIKMKKDDLNTDRLGKIVALAKRGVGGEKTSAIKMVKALCKKHGLDYDEIMSEGEAVKEWRIPYRSLEEERIMAQIIYHFTGCDQVKYAPFLKVLIFETTQARYIETLNALDVLLRAFRKEKKRMKDVIYFGFVTKHNLWGKDSSNGDDIPEDEMAARDAGAGIARHMEDVNIHKQLSGLKLKS